MCPVVGLGIVSISAAALYMLYHGLAQWRILPEHVREYLYISRHKPSYTEPRYKPSYTEPRNKRCYTAPRHKRS